MNVTRNQFDAAAVEAGIPAEYAAVLWSRLEHSAKDEQKFNPLNVAYYFGGLVILGAMTFFFGLAWESVGGFGVFALALVYCAVFAAMGLYFFRKRKVYVAGGLLMTIAVCIIPMAVYGLERALGWWPEGDPGRYHDYHVFVRGSWTIMEVVTIAAAAAALRFVRFPFLTAPIAFTLWYMSMDLTPLLFGRDSFTYTEREWVSVAFGLAMLTAAYVIDRRTKQDFAFWMYLFGLAAFWGGLTSMQGGTPWTKFGYCLINVLLIALSALLDRRIFVVFGSIGVAGYLGYLAFDLFKDSLLLPIALTALGLGVIGAAILYQKHRQNMQAFLWSSMPPAFKKLSPAHRQ
jgi:hypothetical protein